MSNGKIREATTLRREPVSLLATTRHTSIPSFREEHSFNLIVYPPVFSRFTAVDSAANDQFESRVLCFAPANTRRRKGPPRSAPPPGTEQSLPAQTMPQPKW